MKKGRPSGYDSRRASIIIKALAENPGGMWIRSLARATSMHPSTVSRYIDGFLAPVVEVDQLGEKPLLRVVRLKPAFLEKLGTEDMGLGMVRLIELMAKETNS
jgi:hypothetical protein